MGQYMGRTIFAILIGLPSGNAALSDSVEIVVAKPAAGGFPANQALNFEVSPAVMAPTARSVAFGDEDEAAMTVANVYWPSSGTITFSAIAEANGSTITATVNGVKYREIDEQGADVPNGCTMEIGALTLNLKQMMAFQPETNAPASELGTAGLTKLPFTATN
jgi:hypothetical protein